MSASTEHPAYVDIYQPIGGWNARHMVWDDDLGCYVPWATGVNNTFGDGSREGAITEAISLALDISLDLKIEGTVIRMSELLEEASIAAAETGADRELDFCGSDFADDWVYNEILRRLGRR